MLAQRFAERQHHLFFDRSEFHGAGVVAAVARIEDDHRSEGSQGALAGVFGALGQRRLDACCAEARRLDAKRLLRAELQRGGKRQEIDRQTKPAGGLAFEHRALDDDRLGDVDDDAGLAWGRQASTERLDQPDRVLLGLLRQTQTNVRKLDDEAIGVGQREDVVVDIAVEPDDEAGSRLQPRVGFCGCDGERGLRRRDGRTLIGSRRSGALNDGR